MPMLSDPMGPALASLVSAGLALASPDLASPDSTPDHSGAEELDGPEEELPGLLDPLPVLEGRDDELEPNADFLELDFERDLRERVSKDFLEESDKPEGLDETDQDASELAPLPEDSSVRDDDEELGDRELGNDWLVEDSGGSALDDEAEGLEDTDLVQPELPHLQPEDESELPMMGGELPLATAFADEARPNLSTTPWSAIELASKLEACSALASAEGVVVAASSDLLWFASGELGPVRLEAGSSAVHAVTLLGSSWDLAICATENGRLLRRGRMLPASELLRGVREVGDMGARQTLDLCQPGSGFPHALIVRTLRGRMFRSDDDGTSFRPLQGPKVVALAARGAIALASGTLLQSHDGGGSFEERGLTGLAREVSLAATPLIAGCKNVIALGESNLGVLVSTDGGESFRRVPGTTAVTALTVGEQPDGAYVFVAAYDGAREVSHLIRVCPRTLRAEKVAQLSGAAEESEEAYVAQLTWDSVHQRLWLAGGFGVRVFAAPSPG